MAGRAFGVLQQQKAWRLFRQEWMGQTERKKEGRARRYRKTPVTPAN